MERLNQVVVGYDFSDAGQLAVVRAIDLACRAPWHVLHFVTVIDPHTGVEAIPTDGAVDYQYAERVQRTLSEGLTTAFAAHQASEDVHFFVHARIGEPVAEILGVAEDVGADFLIVGSHGWRGMRRIMLGSVSERIVREAQSPVIVARAKGYPDRKLTPVEKVDRTAASWVGPHRYSYRDKRVTLRPLDWPLG
jgi:nucleotide-binding universal stress UspA family protein